MSHPVYISKCVQLIIVLYCIQVFI